MKFPFLVLTVLLLAPWAKLRAELGLPREAYGVWDRSGGNTVAQYPFTRGQAYSETWFNVNKARGSFDWAALDQLLAFADAQNEEFNIQISTVGGGQGRDGGADITTHAAKTRDRCYYRDRLIKLDE